MKKILILSLIALIGIILLTGCTTHFSKNIDESNNNLTTVSTPSINETVIPTAAISIVNTPSPNITPTHIEINVNGLDHSTGQKMGDLISAGLQNLSPLFKATIDDIEIADYKQLAKDALTLQKEVDKQRSFLADDANKPRIENIGELSRKDEIVFQKYIGYLKAVDDYSKEANFVLKFINDENSAMSATDKMEVLETVTEKKNLVYSQLETIFDACEDASANCGKDDSQIKDLKKPKPQ